MAKKPEEDPNEAKKMPLLDHLIELRTRLLYASLFLLAATIGCWFISQDILLFLMKPLEDVWFAKFQQQLPKFIYTSLTEPFFTQVKLAFFGACVLGFPFVAAQLWAFVAPGLYKHERMAFLPFLVATPFLFALGAALLYYILIPFAWQFFINFGFPATPEHTSLELLPKVGEYVSLVMKLVFAFGFTFQMPVLLTLLTRVGILSTETLRQKRRYAIVIVFGVAAVVTPPDPISMLSLAIPLCLLYEVSIWASRLIERQRARREKEEAEAEAESEPGPGQSVSKNPAE